MITVTFDGVEYTKASQVAKQFGYTSDYIGQLCRAKKVNARLVGRSWFVNVPSLEAHREGRYAVQKGKTSATKATKETKHLAVTDVSADAESTDTANRKYLRRVPAPERRLKKAVERVDNTSGETRHVSVSYEADDHSLLPRMTASTKVTRLPVGIAGSEPVKVTSVSKKTNRLVPEPLPDVALSGKLSISEIPDEEYTNEVPSEEKEEKEESSTRDNKKNKLKIRFGSHEKTEDDSDGETGVEVVESEQEESDEENPKEKNSTPEVEVEPSKVTVKVAKPKSVLNTKPKVMTMQAKVPKSAPKARLRPRIAKDIAVRDINDTVAPSPVQIYTPAAAVVFGVLVGSLILSAQQVGFVSTQFVDFDIEFAWSNIRNLASVLFTGS